MFRLLQEVIIRQLKKYMNKDNLNTIHYNDNYPDRWDLKFTKIGLV
jgi:hypothetical protein